MGNFFSNSIEQQVCATKWCHARHAGLTQCDVSRGVTGAVMLCLVPVLWVTCCHVPMSVIVCTAHLEAWGDQCQYTAVVPSDSSSPHRAGTGWPGHAGTAWCGPDHRAMLEGATSSDSLCQLSLLLPTYLFFFIGEH